MNINLEDIKVALENIDSDNVDDDFIQWVTDITLIWATQQILDGVAPVNGAEISLQDINEICQYF